MAGTKSRRAFAGQDYSFLQTQWDKDVQSQYKYQRFAAGGLGLDLIKGMGSNANASAIGGIASQDAALGGQLQSYLQNGTLPAGIQTGVDQAKKQAEAEIRSRYAGMGQSGSTAEAQDINAAGQKAQTDAASIATQLLSQGVSLSGVSASSLVSAAGGPGGNGGDNGGAGGSGGNIVVINLGAKTVSVVNGSAGSAPSGTTGGAGGACAASL